MVHHFVPSVNPRISAGWSITRFRAAYLVAFSRYFGNAGTFCWAPGKTAKIPSIFFVLLPSPLDRDGPAEYNKDKKYQGARGGSPRALLNSGNLK